MQTVFVVVFICILFIVMPNALRPGDNCPAKLAYQEASLEQIHSQEYIAFSNLCYKLGKLGISWDDMNSSDFSQEDQRIFRKYCMEGLNGN